MVMVKCNRHGTHSMKPTDVAVLMDHYLEKLIELAYEPPLPDVAGISDAESLRRVTCPQADLNTLKSVKISSPNPEKG